MTTTRDNTAPQAKYTVRPNGRGGFAVIDPQGQPCMNWSNKDDARDSMRRFNSLAFGGKSQRGA